MAGDISTTMTAAAVPERNKKRMVVGKFQKALSKMPHLPNKPMEPKELLPDKMKKAK